MTDRRPEAIAVARTKCSVKLHAAPGSQALVDELAPDTHVVVYARKRQPQKLWAFVRVMSSNSEFGFIDDEFLEVTQDLTPIVQTPPPPEVEDVIDAEDEAKEPANGNTVFYVALVLVLLAAAWFIFH